MHKSMYLKHDQTVQKNPGDRTNGKDKMSRDIDPRPIHQLSRTLAEAHTTEHQGTNQAAKTKEQSTQEAMCQ